MTKSFQSIRQLMARVLGKSSTAPESQREFSTLGLEPSANGAESPVVSEAVPHSSVFVEAPMMEESEPAEPDAPHCAVDVDMQTADTMQLHPVDGALFEPKAEPQSDGEDEPPVPASNPVAEEIPFSGTAQMNEPASPATATADHADHFGDAFLELSDLPSSTPANTFEDSILDLDGETTTSIFDSPSAVHIPEPTAPVEETELAPEPVAVEPAPEVDVIAAPVEHHEWASVPETPVEEIYEDPPTKELTPPSTGQIALSDLSPEAIDAIARRVIEHMSDRVVREIAWEVVPELSELLIKEKLEQQ